MAVTLPYEFDTIALPGNILKGFVAGSALMLLLALAMLIKHGPLAAAPFPLAAVLFAWIARKFLTDFQGTAKGTITQDAVVVEPSAFGVIRLPSPVGRHPLDQFKAVRVIYLGPGRNSGGYLFANIYLVGLEGTADVCVAYERDTVAKSLAPEIAAAVKLPLEQVGLAPFDH
jgi:hypothetical protein